MNFGKALERVKSGGTARRSSWNKSSFVYLNPGSKPSDLFGHTRIAAALDDALFERGDDNTVPRMPNLNMKTKDGSTMTGWTASQEDMLADDWEISE